MSAVLPTLDEASHTYTLGGVKVPGVTSILAPLCDFSRVNADVLQAAADFGTAVHLACELDDLGTLDEESLDPALAPYLSAWRKFSRDNEVKWTLIEELVYHPTMGYAGKLDRYGKVLNDDAVVDIKSSVQLYPSVGPQLAAYAKAIPEATMLTRRIAVQLRPDGSYVAKKYTSPNDWAVFASLITLRNFCAQHAITPTYKENFYV
jgi:hypothetical protein